MNKNSFVNELSKRGISCDESQLDLLWDFMHHVLETNEKFNLTAIKDEDAFVEKMIFDSALLLNNQNFEGIDLLDIGAGAGFPSVVISILSPKEHDEMIGYVSQLTHVIAVSLMTCKDNRHLVDYTGDSFRDLTRIARINEKMWSELFLMNKDVLLKEMDEFIEEMSNMRNLLANEDVEGMKEKMKISTKRRGWFDK